MNDEFAILYAEPSFFGGFARALDLGNTLTEYNTATTDEQADFFAILSDWQAVGADLRKAAAQIDLENLPW